MEPSVVEHSPECGAGFLPPVLPVVDADVFRGDDGGATGDADPDLAEVSLLLPHGVVHLPDNLSVHRHVCKTEKKPLGFIHM